MSAPIVYIDRSRVRPGVERHTEVDGEAFRGFADLIEMEGIEVYGEPTEPSSGCRPCTRR